MSGPVVGPARRFSGSGLIFCLIRNRRMVRPPKPSPSPVSLETRTLPHNLEAEKAVLGTFFLNDKALLDVQSLLTPEDFYDPRHQDIYRVVLDLVAHDKPIDPVLLINELDRRGLLEKAGGPAYLMGLEQSVISPGNVRHHAELVHEKSLLRRLIQITGEISDDALTERKETQEILEESEKRIFEILTGRVTNEFRAIGEEAHDVYREMERRAEARREVTG
jgi:replicative DNA helicase